jgi:hypothetical protein
MITIYRPSIAEKAFLSIPKWNYRSLFFAARGHEKGTELTHPSSRKSHQREMELPTPIPIAATCAGSHDYHAKPWDLCLVFSRPREQLELKHGISRILPKTIPACFRKWQVRQILTKD